MPEKNIYFHRATSQIQVPSGGLSSLNLSPGDTIYVTDSERNNGAYTVASSNDTQVFVNEKLVDELKTNATITKPIQAAPAKEKKLPETKPLDAKKPDLKKPVPEILTTGEFEGAPPVLIFPPPAPAPEPTTPEPEEKPKEVIEPPRPAPKKPTVPQGTIIERIEFPKWWKELLVSPINLTSPGTQIICAPPSNSLLFIATIVLTVSGEAQLRFSFGMFGGSGWMRFGGTNEPRGMVIATGASPIPCGTSGFSITGTGDPLSPVDVGGFASYYIEKIPLKQPTE